MFYFCIVYVSTCTVSLISHHYQVKLTIHKRLSLVEINSSYRTHCWYCLNIICRYRSKKLMCIFILMWILSIHYVRKTSNDQIGCWILNKSCKYIIFFLQINASEMRKLYCWYNLFWLGNSNPFNENLNFYF